jgi:superoxide reductase
MSELKEVFQSADWKTEKHVPAIECPESVTAGELFEVTVTLGKEVAHPNTTEHHIRWLSLYFHPEGAKNPFEVGNFEFGAHGESPEGPNKGPVYTNHQVTVSLKIENPGTLLAASYCNIHGLWQSSKPVEIK